MVDPSLDNVVRIKRRRTYDDALREQETRNEQTDNPNTSRKHL